MLHRVANDLLAEARENDCRTIAFEDLAHIRDRLPNAGWQHVWAFRRLFQYVECKAAEHDIEAVQVNPRNTSCRCSTCGFTAKENRSGEFFACQSCGYANHVDHNAAKSIGYRCLHRR